VSPVGHAQAHPAVRQAEEVETERLAADRLCVLRRRSETGDIAAGHHRDGTEVVGEAVEAVVGSETGMMTGGTTDRGATRRVAAEVRHLGDAGVRATMVGVGHRREGVLREVEVEGEHGEARAIRVAGVGVGVAAWTGGDEECTQAQKQRYGLGSPTVIGRLSCMSKENGMRSLGSSRDILQAKYVLSVRQPHNMPRNGDISLTQLLTRLLC